MHGACKCSEPAWQYYACYLPAALPATPAHLAHMPINTTHYRITWRLSHRTADEEASYLCLNLTQPVSRMLPVPLATSEEFILEVEPGYDYLLSLIAMNQDGDVQTQPITFRTDSACECINFIITIHHSFLAFMFDDPLPDQLVTDIHPTVRDPLSNTSVLNTL